MIYTIYGSHYGCSVVVLLLTVVAAILLSAFPSFIISFNESF